MRCVPIFLFLGLIKILVLKKVSLLMCLQQRKSVLKRITKLLRKSYERQLEEMEYAKKHCAETKRKVHERLFLATNPNSFEHISNRFNLPYSHKYQDNAKDAMAALADSQIEAIDPMKKYEELRSTIAKRFLNKKEDVVQFNNAIRQELHIVEDRDYQIDNRIKCSNCRKVIVRWGEKHIFYYCRNCKYNKLGKNGGGCKDYPDSLRDFMRFYNLCATCFDSFRKQLVVLQLEEARVKK